MQNFHTEMECSDWSIYIHHFRMVFIIYFLSQMRFSDQASLRLFFQKFHKSKNFKTKLGNVKELEICTYLRNVRDSAKRTKIWD